MGHGNQADRTGVQPPSPEAPARREGILKKLLKYLAAGMACGVIGGAVGAYKAHLEIGSHASISLANGMTELTYTLIGAGGAGLAGLILLSIVRTASKASRVPPAPIDQAPPAADAAEVSLAADQTPDGPNDDELASAEAEPSDDAPAGELERPGTTAMSDVRRLGTDVELRLGEQWLLVVGIVLTAVGVAFFLKYAFDENWIPPVGRVALAYAGGLAFLGIGEWFRRGRLRTFGLCLIGGGIAVFYVAGYAAFQVYHVFEPSVALAAMVLVTVFAGLLSVLNDAK